MQQSSYISLQSILETHSGFAWSWEWGQIKSGAATGVGSRDLHHFLVRYSLDSATDRWIDSRPCLWACQTSWSQWITPILHLQASHRENVDGSNMYPCTEEGKFNIWISFFSRISSAERFHYSRLWSARLCFADAAKPNDLSHNSGQKKGSEVWFISVD